MIIDFHTHIYPDSMASIVIKNAKRIAKIPIFTNGTLTGLSQSMKDANIGLSIVLPVLLSSKQFSSYNKMFYTINENNKHILCFGGMHPASCNYKKEIDILANEMKFKGIKLHPNMQHTYIDDSRYLNIIDYALKKELIVVIHSGHDPFVPNKDYSSPIHLANMIHSINGNTNKIVLAHVGGCEQWDMAEQYLVGHDVHFDLSYAIDKMDKLQLSRIIRNHGSERILFGSDSPWGGQKECLHALKNLHLTKDQTQNILHKNAERLLNI